MHKILISTIAIATLLVTGCSTSNKQLNAHTSANTSINYTSYNIHRSEMLDYINSYRVKGASCAPATHPLNWENHLEVAAQSHARDMAINNYVKHIGSGTDLDPAKSEYNTGSTFIERILYFGYPGKPSDLLGENLNRVSIKMTKSSDLMTNYKRAVDNLIKDKAHCEILMNPRFKDVGAAIVRNGDYYFFAMELGEHDN